MTRASWYGIRLTASVAEACSVALTPCMTVETRECVRGIRALSVGLHLLLGQPSEVGMITVFVIDVRFRNTKAFFSYYENAFVLCNRSGHGACAAPENKLARTVNH